MDDKTTDQRIVRAIAGRHDNPVAPIKQGDIYRSSRMTEALATLSEQDTARLYSELLEIAASNPLKQRGAV